MARLAEEKGVARQAPARDTQHESREYLVYAILEVMIHQRDPEGNAENVIKNGRPAARKRCSTGFPNSGDIATFRAISICNDQNRDRRSGFYGHKDQLRHQRSERRAIGITYEA